MIDNNIGTPEKEEAAPDKVAALTVIREYEGTSHLPVTVSKHQD